MPSIVIILILGGWVIILSYFLCRERKYFNDLMEIKEALADEIDKLRGEVE